jgi:phosphoserine phosphatase
MFLWSVNLSLSADFSSQQLLSANFLNNHLANVTSVVWEQQNKQWAWGHDKDKIGLNVNADEQQQSIVLVGQGINLFALQKMMTTEFAKATRVDVTRHQLFDEFSQQAIVLTLWHNSLTVIADKDCLKRLSQDYFIDCFAVSEVSLSTPGLLVMDMDSTIINMECIDEIANLVGVGDKVSALTERAMQGELDFNQSLNARVDCLDGVGVEELERLKSRLPINPGFAKTMQILQARGWITCIASGGFTYFADYLKDTFELSVALSNRLGVEDNKLTGKVDGDIVNGEMKRDFLLQQANKHQIPRPQTLAIGDGANDLLMMDAAGLGVAYKAKPKVKLAADASIEYCGFEGLLYCLSK